MTAPRLIRPAGRQGPGPIPHGLLESLDLIVARRASGALPGDRRAAGLGSGTELAQLRPYEVGDDVRQIDAAATARTGVPHVRLHVPERTLTTWIALDLSPSMAFGTADRLKSDVAEGVTSVIGRLAVRRAGRVALMTFGAGAPRLLPPRASKPGVVAAARARRRRRARRPPRARRAQRGAAADRPRRDAARPRRRDLRLARRGRLDARARRARAAPLRDGDRGARPARVGGPRRRAARAVDPETGERIEVDTSRRSVRDRFAQIEAERRGRVERELRRLEVEHVVLSTEGDWLQTLGRRLS